MRCLQVGIDALGGDGGDQCRQLQPGKHSSSSGPAPLTCAHSEAVMPEGDAQRLIYISECTWRGVCLRLACVSGSGETKTKYEQLGQEVQSCIAVQRPTYGCIVCVDGHLHLERRRGCPMVGAPQFFCRFLSFFVTRASLPGLHGIHAASTIFSVLYGTNTQHDDGDGVCRSSEC